jgi:hypothetical protein
MTTAPPPPVPPQPHGHGAVVRLRQHVEAVRADANRAAEHVAPEFGGQPDYLISDAIDWALGQRVAAPFSGTPTPGGARAEDVAAEITACHRYLQSTPYSDEADETIDRARYVLKVLEWLSGASDLPPTYTRGTEPGSLTGGRGPIVRPYAVILRMTARAREQLDAGDTAGYGSGPGWHQGVIATLTWVNGGREDPPMAHPGGTCTHPPSDGLPAGAEMTRERGAAEEHIEYGGYQHGDIAPGYADAVACTLRWLYGQTTTPPVVG